MSFIWTYKGYEGFVLKKVVKNKMDKVRKEIRGHNEKTELREVGTERTSKAKATVKGQ